MVIFRLAMANVKKKKSVALTLVFLIFLSALFMNLGMTLSSRVASFYEEKEAELNSPQFVTLIESNQYKKIYEEFIKQDERVEWVEKEEAIYMPTTKNNKNTLELGAVIFNKEAQRKIAPIQLVEEDPSVPGKEAIYLPIMLKGYGTQLGEEYILKYRGSEYAYKVAGFFETTYMGGIYSGVLKYVLSDEAYQKLYEEVGRAIVLSATFKEGTGEIEQVAAEFKKDFIEETDYYNEVGGLFVAGNCIDKGLMKMSVIMMLNIPATLFMALAVIICLIIILIIHFKVVESIEESMQNIGALQAIGYTTKQIRSAIVLEFVSLSVVGSLLGAIVSYGVMPLMADLSSQASGLVWVLETHFGVDLSVIVVMMLLVGLSSLVGSMKIKKLPPVVALRKGVKTHSFSKNYFPLHKGIGSIHMRLGLKTFMAHLKQNLVLMVIIAGGTFVIGIALIMYMNFAFDNSALQKMAGFELSDLQIVTSQTTDTKAFAEEIGALEEVRKTILTDMIMLKIEDRDVQCIISNQFEKMEVLELCEGSFPMYEDEIVITGVLAKRLGKEVGESIAVTIEGKTKNYTITGLSQTTNAGGEMGIIHELGVKRLSPYYEMSQIDVYLHEGIEPEQMIEKLETMYKVADREEDEVVTFNQPGQYVAAAKKAEEKIAKLLADYGVKSVSYAVMLDGEIILSGDSNAYKVQEITNLKNYFDGQTASYAGMMGGMVTAAAVSVLLIIGGILSITIKSMIRKKKEEYGIYKALGYTTKELMRQMAFSFGVVAISGVMMGQIASIGLTNKILQVGFEAMGISQLKLHISPLLIMAIGVVIVLYVYVVAMIKAYSIRKVTAYELLTE